MSSDGGNIGISAEKAMHAIVGGEMPTEEDVQTKEQTQERILAAFDSPPTSFDYGGSADAIAGAIYRFCEAHPEAWEWPVEPEYEWRVPGGEWVKAKDLTSWTGAEHRATGPDLYEEIKKWLSEIGRKDIVEVFSDATGFMWGWAVNAAHWVKDLPPVPNPAIVTIEVKEDEQTSEE